MGAKGEGFKDRKAVDGKVMTVAFTGHRPDKLGGYNNVRMQRWVSWLIEDALTALKPHQAISGMALGVDMLAAHVCVALGIPFIAAVPFRGQESQWPEASQREYRDLISKASSVKVCCHGDYHKRKMQVRNEYMVDSCDVLIAVWDGSNGGTANCVRYAQSRDKQIVYITP